jgi:hypothetical protein
MFKHISVCLWNWIASYNNFTFNCNTILDIWQLEASIPYKDSKLCELIRGVFLWIVWNERNRIIFKGGQVRTIRQLGGSIIALSRYWCLLKGNEFLNALHNILPSNINSLPVQIREITLGLTLSEEED